MSIIFQCHKCNQSLEAKDELAGKMGKCFACKTSVVIPNEIILEAPKRNMEPQYVDLHRPKTCRRCGGSGWGPHMCFSCKGTGFRYDGESLCLVCNGTRLAKCLSCDGLGIIYPRQYKINKSSGEKNDTPLHDVNAKNNNKLNTISLWNAIHTGNLEEVKLHVSNGADVNNKSNVHDMTPLHLAVIKSSHLNYSKIVQFLVSNGSDVNAKLDDGDTPLHLAVTAASINIDNLEVAKLLVSNGADVNAKGNYGNTPLHKAVTKVNRKKIIQFLVSNGADVNVKDEIGITPLYWAASLKDNIEDVQFFVSNGANVNVKTNDGDTPLQEAIKKGQSEVVNFLISQGAQ